MVCYDPVSDTWTDLEPMTVGRHLISAAYLDGKVYAVGGMDAVFYKLDTVECYDISSNTWTTVAPMRCTRIELRLVVMDGKLFALGGRGNDGVLSTVECYDPMNNIWTTMNETMSVARVNSGVVVL